MAGVAAGGRQPALRTLAPGDRQVRYPKEVVLKDGVEAVIRPLEKTDEQALTAFYAALPAEDRWYMRYDATDPGVIRSWIATGDHIFSIVALVDDAVVAHARLHMRESGCYRHMGRLRIIVRTDFRSKRLGTWMLLDLIQCAMDRGLQELRADFVVDQEQTAIETARKLDFFKKAVLEDFVEGPDGRRHDLLIMTKRLHRNWGDF